MNKPLYGVYGASGYGREIMPLARLQLHSSGVPLDRLVFIDDQPQLGIINHHRVCTWSKFLEIPACRREVVLAIANSQVRELLAKRLQEASVNGWSVTASNAMLMDDIVMAEGACLSAFVLLTSSIRIGRYFQANAYSYVGHDCVIGDFVTFAPRVSCNGNVIIEDHAYIGTGAILKQGTPDKPLVIGRGAVIGMGAVVTKSVPPGVTVVGNPARPLVKS